MLNHLHQLRCPLTLSPWTSIPSPDLQTRMMDLPANSEEHPLFAWHIRFWERFIPTSSSGFSFWVLRALVCCRHRNCDMSMVHWYVTSKLKDKRRKIAPYAAIQQTILESNYSNGSYKAPLVNVLIHVRDFASLNSTQSDMTIGLHVDWRLAESSSSTGAKLPNDDWYVWVSTARSFSNDDS